MTNWKEYRLIDIADFIDYRGKTPNKTSFGVPLITAKIVKNGTIQMPTEFISKEDYPKWMTRGFPKVGDVVLTTEAPLGEVAQIKDASFALAQRIITIRGKEGIIDNGYLKYFLQSSKGQHRLKERETGTTVTGIKSAELKQVLISAPDFKTQTAIAEILSSLDDKIELNNKINQELENLAQTLFKQWFIDFEFPNENGEPYRSSGGEMVDSELGEIPKGWKVVSLKELLNNVKKTTKAGVHLSDRKYVPIDELPMKSLTANSFREYSEAVSSLLLFEKFDILIGAMRVYFHRVCIAPFKGVTRSTCFVLRPKNPIDLAFALLLLNRDETISFASATSKGSTMPYAVWENGLADFTVAYPNSVLSNEFNELLFPIFKNLINNSKENIELTNLRNTLLPKLISGELEVSDIQTNTL